MLTSSHCNADVIAIPQLRSIKEQREAEWEEERLRANVGLDELSSQHQVELARQNRQLNELRLQAEQRVRRPRNARSRSILLHYLPASSDYRPLTDRADTGMLWHRTHVIFAGTRGGAGTKGDQVQEGLQRKVRQELCRAWRTTSLWFSCSQPKRRPFRWPA